MRVKQIEEVIERGTDDGLTPPAIAMGIATAINDEWYNKRKDGMQGIIRK